MRRIQFFILLYLLLFLFLVSFLPAQSIDGRIDAGEYPFAVSFDLVTIHWRIDGETLTMGLDAETTGWVSIGLDPEEAMSGADMIFAWVDEGETTVLDCYATGPFGPHPPDMELGGTDDLISFAGTQQEGRTLIEFSRALDSDDRYDKPITLDSPVRLIWAVSSFDDFDADHEQAGFGSLEMSSGTASAGPGKVLLFGHALFLSVSFMLMVIGMILARYLKRKKWWLKTHRRMGLSGGIIGVLGLGLGIIMVEVSSGVHIKAIHSFLGLATIVLIILTPTIGQSILKGKGGKQGRRRFHRWIGRTTLVLMLATILMGLLRAGIF